MNVVLLSYEYPPDTGYGGIGTYAWYHARALVKLGHRVHVIAGATRNGVQRAEHDGVRVLRVQREGWLHRLLGDARARRAWWFQARVKAANDAYQQLARLLHREPVDVVEMPECGGDGMAVTTLLDVPTVVKYHSPAALIMGMYDVRRTDRALTAFAEQIAMNQATAHTSCSRFVADEVKAKLRVRKPITVIANGIDVALFDRDEGSADGSANVRARFDLPRGGVTIFFANRIEERKGSHLLLDMATNVLRRHREAHFVIAGRDLFQHMRDRILPALHAQGLDGRFHYVGALDLPSVRALLKQIDVFLLPSLWENCPYSCIEAMTAGRAIVSSDCGGMPELIAHGENGLLARTGDASAFALALGQLVEDRALRERLGAAARRTVEARLTDVGIAERAVAVYRQAVVDAR